MKFSFVNLFFSCFEGEKFHYIVIKINENHIYRFINSTGKIKLRDIHSKDGITEITVNYKDKNKVLDIAEKMGIKILDIKEKGTYTYITRLPVVKSVTFILAVFTLLLIINSHFIWNIDVEGNYSYTSTQIMRFLNKMDVKEGMRKNRINSDEIEKEIRRKYNDISWVCAEVKGTNLIVHIKENYITFDVLYDFAKEHGVILLNGDGFASSKWSIRVSLANLKDGAYPQIGIAIKNLIDNLYNTYLNL